MALEEKRSIHIILERGRCAWGKCYFCGWGKRRIEVSIDELKRRFEGFIRKHASKEMIGKLKIFSSGSILDEKQFPLKFVRWIVDTAEKYGVDELILESRPEFISEEKLNFIRSSKVKVTVAMGLELADNKILGKYYRKGFRVEDYLKAVKVLRELNFGVRVYILVNGHPILYMKPELQRRLLEKTMKLALEIADSIVIINAYPHVNSDLWEDWIKGEWRPLDENQFKELVKEWKDNPKVELDFNNYNFIPKFPRSKRVFLRGVGHNYIVHPYYEVWQDYFTRFYKPPREKNYALFLPCSYRKPYTKSKTWGTILNAISGYPYFKRLHLIAVSSPGVVPYEFIKYYPFNSYDWPEWLETEEIKREYIDITRIRVRNYVNSHKKHYKHYFAYFRPDSETIKAIKLAFKDLELNDKLTIILDHEIYNKIVKENFKPAVAHPLAIEKLKSTLKSKLQLQRSLTHSHSNKI